MLKAPTWPEHLPVEGQLAIVAAFLPIAFLLRETTFYRIGVLRAGSLAVALRTSWWFVERSFDLAPA